LAGADPAVDNGVVPPLPDDEVTVRLARLPGWARVGDEIERTYELASFPAAIAFVARIADDAEAANHHPDLDIRYRTGRVALSTHRECGITYQVFALATQVDCLDG